MLLNCLCILIHADMEISTLEIGGKQFTYALLSRRCRHRAGTRYNMRGVDAAGMVANFVETEQIVEYKSEVVSFVQTRYSWRYPCSWY